MKFNRISACKTFQHVGAPDNLDIVPAGSRSLIAAISVKLPLVLAGQLTTTSGAGVQETVTEGDLFFWPSGHNVRVDQDAEIIMFSPQDQHSAVISHMLDKVSG